MNENDGTRSFDTVQVDTPTPQKSPNPKPDLKKIITISIFATMTAIILLFCAIIITEVVYKIEGDVRYTVQSVVSSNSKEGALLVINNANPIDSVTAADASEKIKNVYDYNTALKKDNPELVIHYGYTDSSKIKLLPSTIEAFNQMIAALYSETGCGDILLAYGYLDPKPTTLEVDLIHQLGTTVDIKLSVDGQPHRLSKDPTIYQWFTKNAHKYGFINSDPNETVHGSDEQIPSTQFRYIGVAHATYIHESDSISTFEQYVSLLKNSHNDPAKALSVETDSCSYSVYYVAAAAGENTDIKIPENYDYSISGDNMGGFIITVDLSGK